MIDVFQIESQVCHNDTTSVSMCGEVDNNKTDHSIQVTLGRINKAKAAFEQLLGQLNRYKLKSYDAIDKACSILVERRYSNRRKF